MKRLIVAMIAAGAILPAARAYAEPGLAAEVYGPGVSAGETELELRSGFLTGGAADGDWQIKLEASHAVSDWWRPGLVAAWRRDAGSTDFTAFALENVFDFTATRDWAVHFGGYAEYVWRQNGDDEVELKLLLERARGPLDLTLNLIGERHVGSGADNEWEFGYAAEAGYAVNDDFTLGIQGFGDAGTDEDFGGMDEYAHYWGPFTQFELGDIGDGEVELQLGYLHGFGHSVADGQFRVKLEYEFGAHE